MKTIRWQIRVASFVIAILLLLQISPALAGGAPKHHDDERDVVITFTKWITAVVPAVPADATPARILMAGVVGGHVAGTFAGEILERNVSTSGTVTAQIVALEALYEIQTGAHSFTALIRGGQNNATHTALLDGVVLGGWRTGARVHVQYQVIGGCADKPAGPCFQGTIRIERDSDD